MPQTDSHVDESIAAFFSETSATREQCDAFARRFGEPVPVQLQGVASYTVRAGAKVVQFREEGNSLDEGMLALAGAVHPGVVAACEFHGRVGGSGEGEEEALSIYSMDELPGTNYIYVRHSLAERLPLQLATVRCLAKCVSPPLCLGRANDGRFFAQSWLSGRPTDPAQVTTAIDRCETTFAYLTDSLPPRFASHAAKVQSLLPLLRSGDYPVVLTHGDLNEMNILVEPESGEITGVVDWAEASFQPFGFALYALDNALGGMGPDGWKYYDNTEYLRGEFWGTFCGLAGGLSEGVLERIRLARVAGLLIRYGTPYESGLGGMIGVRSSTGGSLRYLDALLD